MRATPPRAKPFCDLTAAADLAIDQGVSASKQPIILRNNRIGLAKMLNDVRRPEVCHW
jgi:hypothetical protein